MPRLTSVSVVATLLVALLAFGVGCAPADEAVVADTGPRTKAESTIQWGNDYDDAVAEAKKTGKPVLIDFYTDWCGFCKQMDREVFTDSEVVDLASKTVPVKIDAERQPMVARQFRVQGYPTVLLVDGEGKVKRRVEGYVPAAQFVAEMKRAL